MSKIRINVRLDNSLTNITELFMLFKKCSKSHKYNQTISLIIKDCTPRAVKISKNTKTLTITGNDIDNLYNPFNLIGILQAFFRFTGLHSIAGGSFLLHGSATIYNNKAICFADDGSSTAKTLASIIIANKSGKYIGDEFCFLDDKYNVSSYDFIPLHIREVVYKYLKNNYRNMSKLISKNEYKTKAGYFIAPNKLYTITKTKKLSAFIFVHFTNDAKPSYKHLNTEESKKAILHCLSAHLIKFFNPHMDRMQFIAETDSTKKPPYKKQEVELIKRELKLNGNIDRIAKNVPCYQIYVNNPNNILHILKEIKL